MNVDNNTSVECNACSFLCHHLSRRHPLLHVVTEHRAHVDQYEQHASDAQSEHGRFRRTRFDYGDRLVCKRSRDG